MTPVTPFRLDHVINVRQWLSRPTALLIASIWVPCGLSAGEAPVVIDMHTHVFNAHDLPIGGIIRARAIPLHVLAPVVEFLLACTDDYEPERIEPRSLAERDREQPLKIADADKVAIRSFLGYEEQLQVRSLPSSVPSVLPDGRQLDADSIQLAAAVMDRADFPPRESEEPRLAVRSLSLENALRFIGLIRKSQLAIAEELRSDYPGVELFVHHMMDLAATYGDQPITPFPVQIVRMGELEKEPALAGRLLHFVAYDPFRLDEALDTIRERNATTLKGCAVGVKFYPPSGYRPVDNHIEAQPGIWDFWRRTQWRSRYAGLGGADRRDARLDELADQLFSFCAQNDIPVFTHCTGFGFQAVSGYGLYCDPRHWRKVLEKYPRLRLCFGHAGGDAWWFSEGVVPPSDISESDQKRWTFGWEVVKLCRDFENVYCEVGYLEEVLYPGPKRERFIARLRDTFPQPTAKSGVNFGHKIMYGTDWHQIYKERDYKKYLGQFQTVFSTTPELAPYRDRFFAGTAAEFIKLSTLAQDGRFSVQQRQAFATLLGKIHRP
jgi:predicted TIM-barrel fold metal-dependent hydrolase